MFILFKKLGIPALIYLLVLSIGLGPALAHAHCGDAANHKDNGTEPRVAVVQSPEPANLDEIELAPLPSNHVRSDDHVISIPPEVLDQLSTACKPESAPTASLGDRCSKAVIGVLSSYPFVLSEIAFFLSWWIYNYFSPNAFDPAPTYAGNGVTTTILEEYFGTFDVMNQNAITKEQDRRAGLQQEVIQQSLDIVKQLKNYKLDPAQSKVAIDLSVENSKRLLTQLGFSPQGKDWQQHWNSALQNLTKPDNLGDRSTDFISRNLRSPEYLIFFTAVIVGWITANSLITDSVDAYPFPYLNTILCALTTVEFSLVLKVMKRRAVKEQRRDAITELLDARHLIQVLEHTEAESGLQNSADAMSLSIPSLDQIPVPLGSDPSTFLSRGVQRINRMISSYPYVVAALLTTGGWLAFNCLSPNPIDPGPAFPALNVTNAIVQEYFSSFEVMAQNSTHTEELRLARLHNALLGKTLDLTEFQSPGVNHSPEEVKAKVLEIKAILQEHGLPTSAPKMDAFYKEKIGQLGVNPDRVTDFVSNYLRSWGYLGFLTAATAAWMTANSVAPGAIDPYPFVAFNIGLTVWITAQESFVIRIMLRQNDSGVMRRRTLYWLDALKLTELLPSDEALNASN